MRRTLVLWNTVILLVLFGVLGLIVRGIVQAGMYAAVDRELALRSEKALRERGRERLENRPPQGRGNGKGNPFKPHVFGLDGVSISPPGNYPLWDADAFVRCQREGKLTTTIVRDDEPLRVLSVPVWQDGTLWAVVQTPYPVSEVERARGLLDRALLGLVPLVLMAAWGGALLLTGRVLHSVTHLRQAAESLSASNLSQRLPVVGHDELAELATTFNGMLARLEAAFERQRRFTSDASHELKTPLTVIKGTTSMTLMGPESVERYKAALKSVEGATDTLSQLVQDLLYLSRADAGDLGQRREPVRLSAVVEQALALVPAGAPVVVAVEAGPVLLGNEPELVRLLVNLLSNAVRHTPVEGMITVTGTADGFMVADTGVGIAAEHLPHLGERFYRVEASRTRCEGGTGLGLAICKGIVEAHGGSLTFESIPQRGTTVRVRLPLRGAGVAL